MNFPYWVCSTLNPLPLSLYPRLSSNGFQAQFTGSSPRWRRRQATVSTYRAAIETCGAARGKISSRGRAYLELHQLGCHPHVRVDAIQLGLAEPAHRDDVSLLAVR